VAIADIANTKTNNKKGFEIMGIYVNGVPSGENTTAVAASEVIDYTFDGSSNTATISLDVLVESKSFTVYVTGESADIDVTLWLRLNTDTGNNYDTCLVWLQHSGATHQDTGSDGPGKAYIPFASLSVGEGGGGRIQCINFKDPDNYKVLLGTGFYKVTIGGATNTQIGNAIWRSNAVVTSVTLLNSSGKNFSSTTKIRIVGGA